MSDFIWAKVRKKETKDLEPVFALTQSLVQKFLREEFEIHIVSRPFYDSIEDKTTYVSDVLAKNYPNKIIKSPRCDTYEEALEYALEKSFKLLLDEKK